MATSTKIFILMASVIMVSAMRFDMREMEARRNEESFFEERRREERREEAAEGCKYPGNSCAEKGLSYGCDIKVIRNDENGIFKTFVIKRNSNLKAYVKSYR